MTRNELRATVSASPTSGLIVVTGPATIEPASYPLTIQKGATWTLNVSWQNAPNQPVDLSTGYTAAFVVRYVSGETALISLTNGSGITLAATEPTIVMLRSSTLTAAYAWGPRARYLLSVTRTSDATLIPLLAGTIDLVGLVT